MTDPQDGHGAYVIDKQVAWSMLLCAAYVGAMFGIFIGLLVK